MAETFGDDWVTKGWAKMNGIWYEIGAVPGVTVADASGIDSAPDLSIHEVADKLNELEARAAK